MSSHTNRKSVTAAMLVATFLAAIEVTVVSTAMPTIVSDLGGMKLISWVYAIYLLTTAVTTPIYGKLADLFGRKKVFMFGTIVFLIGSMLSGLSQTMEQLIWFRALQGIGAGAVLPITFTIIGDIYTFQERAKIQGLFSAVWGVSGILGPLVGGFFVDLISWRWIFYFNLPFGLLSMIMIAFALKENFEKKKKHIDYAGAITFMISMGALLYALLTGGVDYAWDSGVIIGLFIVAAVLLVIFILIERKSPEPMLPLSLFTMRIISVSNLVSFFVSAVLIGTNAYIPLWMQGILGSSATSSGLTLTPMSIAWTIGAIIGGRLMLKIGSRMSALLGLLAIFIGGLWLASADINTPHWQFIVLMALFGAGFGFSVTSFTIVIQSAVGMQMRGASTAANSFMRTLGQTVGVAVLGTMFNHALASTAAAHGATKMASNADQMNQMLNPAFAAKLPADVLATLRQVLAGGLHSVYLGMAVTAGVAFLLAVVLLPRHNEEATPAAGAAGK